MARDYLRRERAYELRSLERLVFIPSDNGSCCKVLGSRLMISLNLGFKKITGGVRVVTIIEAGSSDSSVGRKRSIF